MKYNIMNHKLYIGLDSFDLNEISNISIETINVGIEKVLVDEDIDYSTTKGFLGYVLMDHPVGLLGGVEVNQTYVKVAKERIDLVLTLKNKIKRYTLGTYHTLDDKYDNCLIEGNRICEAILRAIEHCNDEVNHIDHIEENIFIRALKGYINFIIVSIIFICKGIGILTIVGLKVCFLCIKYSLLILFGVFYYLLKRE